MFKPVEVRQALKLVPRLPPVLNFFLRQQNLNCFIDRTTTTTHGLDY
jgi:hypothetical protein